MAALVELSGVPREVAALVDVLPHDFAMTTETTDGQPRGICIEATRIAVEVLHRLGVPCRPMACDVFVFNAAGREHYERGVPVEEWPPEAWSIGVSLDAPPDLRTARNRHPEQVGSLSEPFRRSGWDGHLVVHGGSWMLDLTAEQFSRPDKGLVIEGALAGPIPEDQRGVDVGLNNNATAVYVWRPEVARWRSTPAWRQDVDSRFVDRLAGAVRERVAKQDATVRQSGRMVLNPEPLKVVKALVCRQCRKRAPWCSCGAADYGEASPNVALKHGGRNRRVFGLRQAGPPLTVEEAPDGDHA